LRTAKRGRPQRKYRSDSRRLPIKEEHRYGVGENGDEWFRCWNCGYACKANREKKGGSHTPNNISHIPETKLLLHLNNDDGDLDVTDSGGNEHTITNSNVAVSTTTYKFGDGSAEFSASDYLSIPNHGDFVLNNTDWTWDCWIRPTGLAGTQALYYHPNSGDSTDYVKIYVNSGNDFGLEIYKASVKTIELIATDTVYNNSWHHLAVTYTHGITTYRLYVNGVREVNTVDDDAWDAPTGTIYIGSDTSTSFLGQMDEVRLLGTTKWTGAYFGPPEVADEGYLVYDTSGVGCPLCFTLNWNGNY